MKIKLRATHFGIWAGIFLLFSGIALSQPLREAIVSKINGDVNVRIGEGDWEAARAGVVLHERDEIRTAPGSSAEILLDKGASTGKLELKEKSFLKFDTMKWDAQTGDKATLLDLAIGKVLVHAEKLTGDSNFKVRTPTSTTGVRGTVFEVAVEEK